MQLPEAKQRLIDKLVTLKRVLVYAYKIDIKSAIARDILLVSITALEMYFISLGGKFLDETADVIMNFNELSIQNYFATGSFQMLALMLAVWITIRGFESARTYFGTRIRERNDYVSKTSILNKLASQNQQEIETKSLQHLLSFVPNFSIERIYLTYENFTDSIRHLIRTLSALAILYYTFGPVSLTLLLIGIPEAVMHYFQERKLKKFRESETEGIKYIDHLMGLGTTIRNFSELRVNNTFKYLGKKYYSGNFSYIKKFVEKVMHRQIDSTFVAVLDQILLYGFIIYILFYTVKNRLTIGDFKASYDYSFACFNSATLFAINGFMMLENASYAGKYLELMDYKGFGDMPSDIQKLGPNVPEIKFENLDFKYPRTTRKILENLNVTIKPGQKVAFVGGDGSGKSTLVKMLAGLYRITAGDFTLDGLSVRELERGEHKKKISVLFQEFVRYQFTIRRNITLSSDQVKIKQDLYEKAKKAAMVDQFMEKYGFKDEQVLGKVFRGGVELSQGHWQRLAIARMLYRNRDIFILDEPFTYIDGQSREQILKNIFEFAGKDRTVIYISQDTDLLDMFDTIYFLEDGKIVEQGKYKDLFNKKGRFYRSVKLNS